MGKTDLDVVLATSQFKKQVDSLGPDLFSLFSDFYERAKVDELAREMFPESKAAEFEEVSRELMDNRGENMGLMHRYLMDSNDFRMRTVFGKKYGDLQDMRRVILGSRGKEGYAMILNKFAMNVYSHMMVDDQGRAFYRFKGVKFVPNNDDEFYILLYAKTIEGVYDRLCNGGEIGYGQREA